MQTRTVSEAALDAAIDLELGRDSGHLAALTAWLRQQTEGLETTTSPSLVCLFANWVAQTGGTVRELRDRLSALVAAGLGMRDLLTLHCAMLHHERATRDTVLLTISGPLMAGDGV